MTDAAKAKLIAEAKKKIKKDDERFAKGEVVKMPSYLDEEGDFSPTLYRPVESLVPDSLVLYNGTRRTGKSWICRFFLYHQRHYFRCGEVFTNTPMNGFWQKHFPEWKVMDGWRPGTMQAIMKEQGEVVTLWQKYPDMINPYRVVVLEDIANDLTHDRTLEDLAAYGRHLCLSIHVITQHPQKLPPLVRSNADVVVVLPMATRSGIQTIVDDYLSTMPEKKAKDLVTTYAWKKPKVSQAVVVTPSTGNTVREKVSVLQAPDPGYYQIGCEEYWNGECTVPTEEELEEQLAQAEESDDTDDDD